MYRVERSRKNIVQLGLGDEILDIKVGGLVQLRKYIEGQQRLVDIQKKLEAMKDREVPLEIVSLLGETIVYLFTILFGEENTKKIVAFFEDEYDEMFSAILPFINKEIIPKMREIAQAESEKVANEICS